MTRDKTPLPGLIRPWRLPPDQPAYMDCDTFHLLADQPVLAALRSALGQEVGGHWSGPGLDQVVVDLVPHADVGQVAVLRPGQYAGFTAAGLPIFGTASVKKPIAVVIPKPSEPYECYRVVAFTANPYTAIEGLTLDTFPLPTAPEWLLWHLPIVILEPHGEAWKPLSWEPMRLSWEGEGPGRLVEEAEACSRLREQAWILVETARTFNLSSLSALAASALQTARTMEHSSSLARQWESLCGTFELCQALFHQFSPLEPPWPEWRGQGLGAVGAHFQQARHIVLYTLVTCLERLAAAATGVQTRFGDLRKDWWLNRRIGDVLLLPGLKDSAVSDGLPRAARLAAVGAKDATGSLWTIPVPESLPADEKALLMIIPVVMQRQSGQATITMEIIEPGETQATPTSYPLKVRPGAAWTWKVVPCQALKGSPGRRNRAGSTLCIHTQKLPPVAGCLLFQLLV